MTLAESLIDDRVEFDELHEHYHPVLAVVNLLIGVVPNCDRYLEIWPVGFRTYNLMVPNFLNLPGSMMGRGAPKDVVGLAMYTSSRSASCAYCSAHCCSFALRRGSSAEAVTGEARSPGEAAAVAVAEALSTVPHRYTPELGQSLREHYSTEDAEWIVMSVAMMGFLNKFMDAIGVDLEAAAVGDVAELIEPTGWSLGQHGWAEDLRPSDSADDGGSLPPVDNAKTLLRMFRAAPGAIRLDRGWMKGTPKDAEAARAKLVDDFAFDDPLLTTIGHAKPRRALGAMLRHNLDPAQSELGIGSKALVGAVFGRVVGSRYVAERAGVLAEANGVSTDAIRAAEGEIAPLDAELDERTVAALALAEGMATSPAVVLPATVEQAVRVLSPVEVVEVAVWLSVCQLQHRLALYFDLDGFR